MSGRASARGLPRGPAVGLVFLLGALAAAALLLSLRPGSQTGSAQCLVDARLPLRSEGALFPFTLAGPAEVEVLVELPAMLDGKVALGPLYAAMRPELIYEPDAREDRVLDVHGCETPAWRERIEKAGAYAVRVPAIPTAMGMESEMFVTVRVTARYDAP